MLRRVGQAPPGSPLCTGTTPPLSLHPPFYAAIVETRKFAATARETRSFCSAGVHYKNQDLLARLNLAKYTMLSKARDLAGVEISYH